DEEVVITRLGGGAKDGVIAIDLHENIDGGIIGPLSEAAVGGVEIVTKDLEALAPAQGHRRSHLIATGENRLGRGPPGSKRDKGVIGTDEMRNPGRIGD